MINSGETVSQSVLHAIAWQVRDTQRAMGLMDSQMAKRLHVTVDGLERIKAGIIPPKWLALRDLCIQSGRSADSILQIPKRRKKA